MRTKPTRPSMNVARLIRFLKDWTLPVAMTFGAAMYLIFGLTPALDGIATVMSPFFDAIFPLFMFLILYVTFCKIDFRRMRPKPWHLWVTVFQVLFVAATMACILCLRLSGNGLVLAESVLTCIIGPCAAAAAVVTAKLGGNLESMTTYTFLSNIVTAILVPLAFPLIDPQHASMSFLSAFFIILREVCLILLVPMLLAYLTKHLLPRFHRWVTSVKDLSFYLWGCSLTIVTGTTVKHIVHADTTVGFLLLVALCALLLCLLQFATGRRIGSRFGCAIDAGQALGQKNTAFAIWIAYTYLTPLSSVGPGCYILWQNIINSLELWQQKRAGTLKAS